MQLLSAFKTSISYEINQKEILQKNLVLKVLSSKRLLVDHVEIIEESLDDLMKEENSSLELLTFLKTAGVFATSYVVFIHFKQNLRYLIPSVGGIIPLMYIQKLVNVKKRESLEAKLARFTTSLDKFESAIKKNKTFLQESHVIKSSESVLKRFDKDNKIPLNLIESIKKVVNALFSFVKLLETYAISEKLSLIYEPFEDLQDCELMTANLTNNVDLKDIKDFFNIFAYVQSQVLLRFALITVTNLEACKSILDTKIEAITLLVQRETANISKFLEIINSVSKLQQNIQKQIDEEISMTIPKELREVRTGSIKFSAKVLAIAIQCQQLEELIVKFADKYEHPSSKEIEEILAVMKAVENEMSVSIDEHKRIAISFQKYLNMETDEAKISQEKLDGVEGEKENVKLVTEDDVASQSDDFFFVDGTTNVTADEPSKPESIEEVNSKLAKKYFKPVLVQLKERIEVIGEDMKERERKVLKAKGIEINEEPEIKRVSTYSDENSGSDDELDRKRKFQKNEQKFSDNREFLESKQPINIFDAGGFPLLLKSQALDEDVLE